MPRHGLADPRADAAQAPEAVAAKPAARGPRRGGIASWPVRRKFAALAALPLLVIAASGGFIAKQSFDDMRAASSADVLADAAKDGATVTKALDTEQFVTRQWLDGKVQRAAVDQAVRTTDAAYATLLDRISTPPDGGWSERVNVARSSVVDMKTTMANIRAQAQARKLAAGPVLAEAYSRLLNRTRDLGSALASDLSSSALDGTTVEGSSTLAAVAKLAQSASIEANLLTTVLSDNRISDPSAQQLLQLKASQLNLLDIAGTHATQEQSALLDKASETDARIEDFRTAALALQGKELAPNTQSAKQAADFVDAAIPRLQTYDDLAATIAGDLEIHADKIRDNALWRTVGVLAAALLSIIIVTLLALAIARTVTGPMRRLRTGAVDAATVRLPAAVRQIEREGPDAAVAVPPVLPPDAAVGPEIREVAQALDGLTGETIRLATSQVRLRQALDEAFVSMSRRSQSMVEKQLAIIDELESTEEDPEQLRNLFRLDHLAARMRRYNDNLLVLAGSSVRTRSAAPVPIADVFRAATSEMEQYERVRLQPLSGASVAGASAGGLIHLLAELLDNAAMYSPPTSPIVLAAAFTPDGGLRLEVTDSGVGIPPAELTDLNARLAMPGSIDTQVPSRMGLYVVARLAQRGGFAVRLSARPGTSGTVAEVVVPPSLVIGAPTGPVEAGTAAPVGPAGQAEPPRLLPAQHGVTATPLRGITRPAPGRPGTPGTGPLSPAASPAPPAAFGSGTSAPAGAPAPAGPLSSPSSPSAPAERSVAAAGASALTPDGSAPAPLPSRRPGAALAGNPLAAAAANGSNGTNGSAAPSARAAEAPPRSPFESAVPWTERSQGSAPAAGLGSGPGSLPGAGPGAPAVPGNGAAAGIQAGRRLGAGLGTPPGAPAAPFTPNAPAAFTPGTPGGPGTGAPSTGLPGVPGLPTAPAPSAPGATRPSGLPTRPVSGRGGQGPGAPVLPGVPGFPGGPTAPAGPAADGSSDAGAPTGPAAGTDAPRRDLPRRERGASTGGTMPFTVPGESPSSGPGAFEPPPGRPSVPAGDRGTMPGTTPGNRAGLRPAVIRAPGEPGGAPALGPSAATAAAAAAAARPRTGPAPTSGLFAPTGPATGPLVAGRPGAARPDGPATAQPGQPGQPAQSAGQPSADRPGTAAAGPASLPTGPSALPALGRTGGTAAQGPAPTPPATPEAPAPLGGLPRRSPGASDAPGWAPPGAPAGRANPLPGTPSVPPAPQPPQAPEAKTAPAPNAPNAAGAPAGSALPTRPTGPAPAAGPGAAPGGTRAARWPAFGAPQAPGSRPTAGNAGPGNGATGSPAPGNGTGTAGAPSAPAAGPSGAAGAQQGQAPRPTPDRAPTPIFDSISVWFEDDRTAPSAAGAAEAPRVIDLREPSPSARPAGRPAGPGGAPGRPGAATRSGATAGAAGNGSSRWSSLGDQRWIATNARAAARPETAGETQAGLPRRRPGANLLPSATNAAATAATTAVQSGAPSRRTDAESVRGRLGSYQRGLTSARRARHLPPDGESGGLFSAPPVVGGSEAGPRSGGQGGDS